MIMTILCTLYIVTISITTVVTSSSSSNSSSLHIIIMMVIAAVGRHCFCLQLIVPSFRLSNVQYDVSRKTKKNCNPQPRSSYPCDFFSPLIGTDTFANNYEQATMSNIIDPINPAPPQQHTITTTAITTSNIQRVISITCQSMHPNEHVLRHSIDSGVWHPPRR
jgi:hypothetical protein